MKSQKKPFGKLRKFKSHPEIPTNEVSNGYRSWKYEYANVYERVERVCSYKLECIYIYIYEYKCVRLDAHTYSYECEIGPSV